MGRSAPCPGTEEPGHQARTVPAAARLLCITSAWALIPMIPHVGFQFPFFSPMAVQSAAHQGSPELSSCALSHLPLQWQRRFQRRQSSLWYQTQIMLSAVKACVQGKVLPLATNPGKSKVPSGRGFGFSNPPSCMSSKAKETFKT